MPPIASSLFIQFATGAGGFAAMIAVCAFIGQLRPGLREKPDSKVRRGAVMGGIGGMGLGLFLIFLSAIGASLTP